MGRKANYVIQADYVQLRVLELLVPSLIKWKNVVVSFPLDILC